MEAVHKRVAGIDVHRMKHVVTILIEQADGVVSSETREFGGFKPRRKPYRDSAFDYEAASVAKNAPRWIRALKKYGYWPQVTATS